MVKKDEPKERKLSAQEIKEQKIKGIISQVEQLTPGEGLIYQTPEYLGINGAVFLIIELNPSFPGEGKKYIFSTDKIVDGRPSGQRAKWFESDKPAEYASWVLDRLCERFTGL